MASNVMLIKCFYKTITIFFYLLQIPEDSVAMNVALRKNGTYCGKTPASGMLFDGDTNNVVSMAGKCDEKSYVEIDLGFNYEIHFVVVHGGKEHNLGQLDFFLVQRLDRSTKELCSQYPGVANVADFGRGMRVNCEMSKNLFSKIQIESLKNEGLQVAEIEVHMFEIALPYIGCFESVQELGELDWATCQQKCLKLNSIIVTKKADRLCGCISDSVMYSDNAVPAKKCFVKCDDNHCSESYVAYLLKIPLPFYKGCVKTYLGYVNNAELDSNMTVERCLHQCDSYPFVLLEDKDFCICEISIDEFSPADASNCNSECTGDPNLLCGGKEHASVYSTCLQSHGLLSFVKCSELFQCVDSHDMFGTCRGGCKPGFFGQQCIERDIDKCEFDPCDNLSSICRNIEDSYICDCKPGFSKTADGKCSAGRSYLIELDLHLYYLKMAFYVGIPLSLALTLGAFFCKVTRQERKTNSTKSKEEI